MISLWNVAIARGVHQAPDGSVNMGEFVRVGIPIMGGCEVCGAAVAAYNAGPSKSGFIRCLKDECLGDQGFSTVEEFEQFNKERG